MKFKMSWAWFVVAVSFGLNGCNYDVPLTARPTRLIENKLLGDWASVDKTEGKEELMHVRKLDDSVYVIAMDNDLYRAFHSDFADTTFLSVQDLNSVDRKYLYFVWRLSPDGSVVSLKGISTKVVPDTIKTAAELRRLIKRNLGDPKLFGDEIQFTRKNSAGD